MAALLPENISIMLKNISKFKEFVKFIWKKISTLGIIFGKKNIYGREFH